MGTEVITSFHTGTSPRFGGGVFPHPDKLPESGVTTEGKDGVFPLTSGNWPTYSKEFSKSISKDKTADSSTELIKSFDSAGYFINCVYLCQST